MERLAALVVWFAVLAIVPGAAGAEGYKPSGSASAEATYIFGIHPYSNPQDLFEAYEPVARYLEQKIPGVKFRIEASKDYADFESKLVAGKLHFALPNPLETLLALDHGYRVVAKMTPDDDFRGLFVARKDKGFKSLADLKGKTLSFPSATAVAGTLLPLLHLHGEGLAAGKDIQVRYVGSQFSSILNAYAGETDACGSTVRFWRVWSRNNPDKAAEMEVLGKTDALPHNAVVARKDVEPAVARQVAKVLAAMDKDPTLDMSQFKQDQAHFELAADAAYQPMRDFLVRYDRALGLPEAMKKKEDGSR